MSIFNFDKIFRQFYDIFGSDANSIRNLCGPAGVRVYVCMCVCVCVCVCGGALTIEVYGEVYQSQIYLVGNIFLVGKKSLSPQGILPKMNFSKTSSTLSQSITNFPISTFVWYLTYFT